MHGFVGSMVIGITRWSGSIVPTAPQNTRYPLATRSRMVWVIHSSNASQEWLLANILGGGDGSSYRWPANDPAKGTIKLQASTPLITKDKLWSASDSKEIDFHCSIWLCSSPGTKHVGSLKIAPVEPARTCVLDTKRGGGLGRQYRWAHPSRYTQVYRVYARLG